MVPAKLEAYKALTCSASVPVSIPKGILVVSDCETEFLSDVVYLNDEGTKRETAVKSALNKIKHYYLVGVSEPRYTVQIW